MEQDNSVKIDSVVLGCSNDEYGSVGSVFDARGVNIRENSKYRTLDSSERSGFQVSQSDNDIITGIRATSTTTSHYVSASGNIYNYYYRYGVGGGALFDGSYFYVNTTVVKTGSTYYGVAIGTAGLHRWVYNIARTDLGILGDTIVTNGDFATDSDWTKGTGRTIDTGPGRALHSDGSASDLVQTQTVDNTTKYRGQFTVNRTAGTLTVKMGGTTYFAVTTTGTQTLSFFRTTTGTSEDLTFSASSDFVGYVSSVIVQKSNMVENYNPGTDTIVTASRHPYIDSYPYLYIGGANTVSQIDYTNTAWVVENILILPTDEEIIGMTNIGTRFYIYTNKFDTTYGFLGKGKQYLWDGVSRVWDEVIERPNKQILGVTNNGTFDYVVTSGGYNSSYRELYKVSGWDRAKLFQSGHISDFDANKFGFIPDYTLYCSSMAISRDIVYICSKKGLWTYGAELPGFPESICKYIGSTGEDVGYCVSSDFYGDYIHYSALISGVPRVLKMGKKNLNRFGNEYKTGGYIEYNPIIWDGLSSKKKLEKLQIGYQLQGSTTNFQIYAKIDDGSYTLIKTVTGTGTTTAYGRTNVVTNDWIIANAGNIFYKIQFKIVLNTTDSTVTPKIFDFNMRTDLSSDVF